MGFITERMIHIMNKFEFESEFVEVNNQVLKVFCKSKNKTFSVLIDTYNDPYMIYYNVSNIMNNEDKNDFTQQIFDYLSEKYPEHF